eukprot:462881-Pyramimonas_sp.AAC.1
MVDAEGHLESSPGKHTDLVQKASLLAKAFALVRKDDAKRVNELFKFAVAPICQGVFFSTLQSSAVCQLKLVYFKVMVVIRVNQP